MNNNYSYNPENAASTSDSAPVQSGLPSTHQSQSASAVTPASSPSHNGSRQLQSGAELSSARYKIDRRVAAGGMGAVYRAIDTRFNRPCAVKEMLDEFQNDAERSQAVEWFSREATLLLDLNHPCIPRVRDFFVENGKHYLVMDFIEGRTLGEVLEKEGNVIGVNGARGVSEARARAWMQQICSVLGYLHRLEPPIIFRDLKPSNIMVTDRDEIKLIDFGIARTFQSQRQATIIMTVGYAPPEQLHGRPEPRSDLYALGATLHRVLTHHDASNNKPSIFSFPTLRSLRPDITPAFEHVVMKALSPVIEQRWPSAAEMERAIITLPPITVTPPVGPINNSLPATPQRSSNAPLTPISGGPVSGPRSGPGLPQNSTSATTGPAGPHIVNAQSMLASNRIDAAYASVQLAYSLEPENALIHKIFGQIFARRVPPQPDLAIKAYNKALSVKPDDAETHKLVGDVSLFLLQQPYQGIHAYSQSLRLNPNDFETHLRLAQCYEKMNQLEPALREYQEAARLAPKQPPQPGIFFSLGNLAFRMNQWPVAEHAFVQVLIINPADHQTRFLLSEVYEQENKLEEAFRECSYVVGPLSANPAVQQLFERLRRRLGR